MRGIAARDDEGLHACEIEWHVTGEFDFEQRRKNCLVSARGKRLGDCAGPRVTKHTPGRPVSLPCASAMKAAPPSCRFTMKRARSPYA